MAVLERQTARRTPATTGRRAMFALARVESVRMLRHPVTIGAALLFLAPWAYGWVAGTPDRFPVLHDEAVTAQFLGLVVLGGGALIAANLAALRAHRHHTDPLYDVLVLPAVWRTGALLLALAPLTGVAALLVGVRVGVPALLPGAAGRPDPVELVTTPAVVLLFGTLGVLLARLVRSAVVAPLAALGGVVFAFAGSVGVAGGAAWRLLLPVVFPELPITLPGDLAGRPAAQHLGYLAGLVLLLAVAALIRSGAGGRRITIAAGLAVALTAGFGAAQYLTDDGVRPARITATDDPASMQTCRVRNGVTYCAFPDFTSWVEGWDEVLRGVRRAVPDSVPTGPPVAVRQRVRAKDYPVGGSVSSGEQEQARIRAWLRADAAAGTPEAVTVGTSWGDGPSEAAFAGAVAYRLITGRAADGGHSICGARGALLVWLVGQATPRTAAGLRALDARSSGGLPMETGEMLGGVSVPDADAAAGLALLDKPADEATALIRRHWTELAAADIGADRFASLVGVPAAVQPPVEERSVCAG